MIKKLKYLPLLLSLTFVLPSSNLNVHAEQATECKQLSEALTLPELDNLGFCLYPDLDNPEHERQRRKLEIEHMCDLVDFGIPQNQVRTEVDQDNRDNCLKIRNIRLKRRDF